MNSGELGLLARGKLSSYHTIPDIPMGPLPENETKINKSSMLKYELDSEIAYIW